MILEIIKGTPLWVYLLFGLLIYRGILATQPKTTKLIKLFIMPVVFFYLMAHKMSYNPLIFTLSLVGGCFIGWLIYKNFKIKADKVNKLLQQPGSILPIILIFIGFVKGYFIGYTTAVNPQFAASFGFCFSVALISGITSGIFIGRTAIFLYKYSKAESEDLSSFVKAKAVK